jgi:hypothetical protein
MYSTKNSDSYKLNKVRMFSPRASRNPNNTIYPNDRNIGFRSNPITPRNGQMYMNKRRNQSKNHHATIDNRCLPSIEDSERVKSLSDNSVGTRYIDNLKQVKIRMQRKPARNPMGHLESATGARKMKNLNNFSLKYADQHSSLLSKIEKYKEDKLLQELQQIEFKQAKTAKLLKLMRIKEEKRKAYYGKPA